MTLNIGFARFGYLRLFKQHQGLSVPIAHAGPKVILRKLNSLDFLPRRKVVNSDNLLSISANIHIAVSRRPNNQHGSTVRREVWKGLIASFWDLNFMNNFP